MAICIMFISVVTIAVFGILEVRILTTQPANMCAVPKFTTALHHTMMIIPTTESIGTFSLVETFAYFSIPSVMIVTSVVSETVCWFQSVFDKHSPSLLEDDTPGT